ncbi:methyltransferase [Trypanosoma conorhini]|uniref:Methyltransferase n=1 Tax=Trypanosoma conorhini TaxID=83891 RepID=A0A3R7N5C0_9TRYP|nr:methyltransferase [Trypanosoma conorhini]RNF25654.1 methyltransferase [Trypanosoma conorhini]
MRGVAGHRRGRDDGGGAAPQEGRAARVRPRTEHDADADADAAAGPLSHPFKAEFNDHFETSMEALRDIAVVVEQLRLLLRPSAPENFVVYDPYYCAGTVVRHWNALGVQRVIHENRDFYKDVAEGKVPLDYDMLVTNPPFSGDHIERLFGYLVATKKPFAFLVPDYTAAKDWYRAAVRRHFTLAPSSGKGDINAPRHARPKAPAAALQPPPFLRLDPPASTDKILDATSTNKEEETDTCGGGEAVPIGTEPFYLIPRCRYDFRHPKGAGNDHSHFRSMWFVWAGRRTTEVLRGAKVEFARRQREALTQRQAMPDVVHGLDALAEGHYVQSGLRPNPQRRARQRHGRG